MKFIKLTRLPGHKEVFINTSAISAVSQGEGKSNVYIVGDIVPFEVLEKAEYILILINNANGESR